MERIKVKLIIDYPRIENEDFSKWIAYIEKYLIYGLLQKGIEVLKEGGTDNLKLVYLPVFTSKSITDTLYLSKVKEISLSENGVSLALIKDFDVMNRIKEFTDIDYVKMFIIDQDTGKEAAGSELFSKENLHLFFFKIYDLCSEIEKNIAEKDGDGSVTYKGIVYIAEPSADQEEVKEEVKRELIQRGYKVIPDKLVKGDTKEVEQIIFDNLSKSRLSVHIFGKLWNEPVEGMAGIELENKIAADYYTNKIEKRNLQNRFSRIIWLPDNIVIKDERQQKLLNKIQRDKKLYAGSEIITSSVEELKDIILEKLEKYKESNNSGNNNSNTNSPTGNKNVYIVINEKNKAEFQKIDEHIRSYGFNPVFSTKGSIEERNYIKECNSVLFVYQNDNMNWLKSKISELNKIKTWEYSSTFEKSGILSLEHLELPEDEVFKKIIHIKGNQSLELENFAPFFHK